MNGEFRELAGVSPSEFLATRFAEGSGNTAREPEGRARTGRAEAAPVADRSAR